MPCPRDDVTSKIEHILSVIHYMGLCVFSLPIPIVMIERIYTFSYHHHQIGSMNYHPLFGLGHETMVCAVCLSIFLCKHFPPMAGGFPPQRASNVNQEGFPCYDVSWYIRNQHKHLFIGVRKTRFVAWTLRFELTKTTSHQRNYFTTFSTVAET